MKITNSETNNLEKDLVILSPYEGFESQLSEILNEMNLYPTVIEGYNINDYLISKLNNLFTEYSYPEVIISRGGVASHISKIFKNTVIIRMEPDYFDIINAVNSAKIYGDNIGIIMHSETIELITDKVDIIKNILNLHKLKIYAFETIDDIHNQVICGKSDGMDAMVGGGIAALESGTSNKMPVVFVKSSKTSVIEAIKQALSIIKVRKKERKQLESLKLIVNYISEGVMAINGDKVVLINSTLEDILGIKNVQVFNKKIVDINNTIADFLNKEGKDKEIIKIDKSNFLIEKSNLNESGFAEKILRFHNVEKIQEQEQKIRSKLNAKGFVAKYNFDDIIGKSNAIKNVINSARIYASTDASILISGNSGTGKELLAQSIHNESNRKNGPFVPINCGAIPENLLESEFFGYEEGAFSGAKKNGKKGLFELAHTGTIFLDEINSLPISLQSKLLRVIQEKEFNRIGSDSIISVDVRIIAATNQDMNKLTRNNKFRTDLYYRLNILNLNLPTLSDRKGDIEILSIHFLNYYSKKYKVNIPYLEKHELDILTNYNWPGNVRELENTIHRFVLLYGKENNNNNLIYNCLENTTDAMENNVIEDKKESKEIIKIHRDTLEVMEREIILSYLNEYKWNKQIVADKLGICRSTLWRKLKESK